MFLLNPAFDLDRFYDASDGGTPDGTQAPTDGQQGPPDATTPDTATTPEKTFTQAEVDAILADRLKRAQTKAEKDAEAAKAEADRLAAEQQGEFKTLYETEKAKRERLEADAKAAAVADLKRAAATKAGLPEALIARLVGETAEELEADAQALAETLPKPKAPNINTGTGNGATPTPGQLSDAEKAEMAAIYNIDPRYL